MAVKQFEVDRCIDVGQQVLSQLNTLRDRCAQLQEENRRLHALEASAARSSSAHALDTNVHAAAAAQVPVLKAELDKAVDRILQLEQSLEDAHDKATRDASERQQWRDEELVAGGVQQMQVLRDDASSTRRLLATLDGSITACCALATSVQARRAELRLLLPRDSDTPAFSVDLPTPVTAEELRAVLEEVDADFHARVANAKRLGFESIGARGTDDLRLENERLRRALETPAPSNATPTLRWLPAAIA